jgi:hypothetical protein
MNLDYSSPYSDDFAPDTGAHLIPGYEPYMIEYSPNTRAEPFPLPNSDLRSEEELDRIRHSLRREVSSKIFERPIPLADFCLVAPSKWEASESSEEEIESKYCLLM